MKCSIEEARFSERSSTGTYARRYGFDIGSVLRQVALLLMLLLVAGEAMGAPAKRGPEPILLVVMDPLAKELACACVKGHGQRDYRKLAARLETALKQRVSIEF